MKKKDLIIAIVIIGILVILFSMGGKSSDVNKEPLVGASGNEVPCLPNGHQNIAVHIHPILTIRVNGENETIPANIGIEGLCMREIHTHDTTGTLHIETAKAGVEYTLEDFFLVFGQSIEREGYTFEIMQDGEVKNNPAEVIFSDRSEIVLEYTIL